jgi:hypothetical protein
MSESYKIHYPEAFPPRRYWTSSLVVPWWVNKRQVAFRPELPNPPFATITRGYAPPDHAFQVPCDTITPSSEYYQRTGMIEIIR